MGKNMEMIKVLSAWVEIDDLLLPLYEYLSKGRKYS